ncbi:MAG TPA: GlsB/YeaQ/YmgE family stress response membrane protein [Xanthobacteraceae bacterium]|nr:GlsB/YeaQ/YmgE family stress response membrane protein [Xanthobacteraceae bacterium]
MGMMATPVERLGGTPLTRRRRPHILTVAKQRHRSTPVAASKGVFSMFATNSLLVILIVGLIAGWLAGQIMRGSGFGLIGDLIIGIIGAFIGTWLWGVLHLPTIGNFWISAIVISTVGALVLLFILRLIRR